MSVRKDKTVISISLTMNNLKILKDIAQREELTVSNLLVYCTMQHMDEKYACTINKYDCDRCSKSDTCNHRFFFKYQTSKN